MKTEILLFFLGEFFVKATAVLLLAALIVRAWHRASAAQQHFVWLAAIIVVLLLPLTKFITPWWGLSVEKPMEPKTHAVPASEMAVVDMPIPAPVSPAVNPARPPSTWQLPDWRAVLVGSWLSGCAGLMSYRLLGLWRLRHLERGSLSPADARLKEMVRGVLGEMAIDRPVRVLLSEECLVPMTWGFLRPVLVLPSQSLEWSDSRLAAAVRHEAGHIGRWDYPVRWIAHLACAVYWLHPLIWLASRSLRTAQEQATDDLVLRAGTPPEEYATQLFDSARAVAAHGVFARHAVAMATPSTLENRVLAIVDDQRDRRSLSRLAATVGALASMLTLALCTVAQLQGAPPPSADASAAVKPLPAATGPSAEERASKIILPKVEFNDTPLIKVLESLRQQSHELAPINEGVDIEPKAADAKKAPPPAPAPLPAAPGKVPIDLTADVMEYIAEGRLAMASGHVVVRCGTATLTADYVTLNVETRFAEAFGNVEVRQPANESLPHGLLAAGDRLVVGFRADGRATFFRPEKAKIVDPAAPKPIEADPPGKGDARNFPVESTAPSRILERPADSPIRVRLGGEIQVSTSIIDRKPIARRPGEN